MTWRRLSAAAITNDAGHEIYRLPDGRFEAWGPPGSFGAVYGPIVEASLRRELEEMGIDTSNAERPISELVTYRDARACIGVYETAEEARRACAAT